MRMFSVCFGVAATLLLGSRVAIKEAKTGAMTVELPAAADPSSGHEVDDKAVKAVGVDDTAVGEVGRRHWAYQLARAKWGGLRNVKHPVWGDEENFCFTVTEALEHNRIAEGGERQVAVGEETCIPMRETSPEIEGTPRWLEADTLVKIGWFHDSVVRDLKSADGTKTRTVTMERLVTVLTEASTEFMVTRCDYLASQLVIATYKGLSRVAALPWQLQGTKGCFNVSTIIEYRKKGVNFGDKEVAVHQEHCVLLGRQLPGVRKLIRSLAVGTSVKLGWSHRYVHFEVGPDTADGETVTGAFVQRPVTVLEDLSKSKSDGAEPDNTTAPEPPKATKPPVVPDEVKTEMMSSQFVKAAYTGTSERSLDGQASVMWACFKVRKTLEYKQQDEDDDVDNQVQVGKEYCARPEEQSPDDRATINNLAVGQKVKLSWQHDKVTRRQGGNTTVTVTSSITFLVKDP